MKEETCSIIAPCTTKDTRVVVAVKEGAALLENTTIGLQENSNISNIAVVVVALV